MSYSLSLSEFKNKFSKVYNINFNFYKFDKLVFLSTEKIGSTFLKQIFKQRGNTEDYFFSAQTSYKFNCRYKLSTYSFNSDTDIMSSSDLSFKTPAVNSILFNSDLYTTFIIVRKPWDRLKAGIITNFIFRLPPETTLKILDQFDKEKLSSLFSRFIDNTGDFFENSNHITLYLTELLNLLRIFNFKNYKILNIDENRGVLEDIISKNGIFNNYDIGSYNSMKKYNWLLEDWIINNPNHPTSVLINTILQAELSAYNQLKILHGDKFMAG